MDRPDAARLQRLISPLCQHLLDTGFAWQNRIVVEIATVPGEVDEVRPAAQRVQPQPKVDLVRDPRPEGAITTTVEAVDADAFPIDQHPTAPTPRFFRVVHVGEQFAVLKDVVLE